MFGLGGDINWLKQDIEHQINKYKTEYLQGLKSEAEFLDFLTRLKQLRDWIDRKIEELEAIAPERTTAPATTKELTAHEYITVAIAQRPRTPERIKREAEEIIKRYNLTPEEVSKIYESIFG